MLASCNFRRLSSLQGASRVTFDNLHNSQSRAQSFCGLCQRLLAARNSGIMEFHEYSLNFLIGSSYKNTWTIRMETEARILANLAKFLRNVLWATGKLLQGSIRSQTFFGRCIRSRLVFLTISIEKVAFIWLLFAKYSWKVEWIRIELLGHVTIARVSFIITHEWFQNFNTKSMLSWRLAKFFLTSQNVICVKTVPKKSDLKVPSSWCPFLWSQQTLTTWPIFSSTVRLREVILALWTSKWVSASA